MKQEKRTYLLFSILFAILALAGEQYHVKKYIQTTRSMQTTSNHAQTEKEKVAFLTFDDGPGKYTAQYLTILKKHHAHATFFLIGKQIEGENEKLVRRELKEGHEVEIHTYSHDSHSIYQSSDAYYEDARKVKKILWNKFHYRAKYWRFPWGSANCFIAPYHKDIIARLEKENLEYQDWNVSGEDSVGYPSVESILCHVKKDCYTVKEPVILLHDSNCCKATLEALECIINHMEKQGYRFETLSKRSKPCHFGDYS